MPNLPAHMSLAKEAASKVDHPAMADHLGSVLLGSTSPDIRIMTKWKRDQTHFATLDIDRVGVGVEGLFRSHPELADSHELEEGTLAFVSGYLTHLVADETWILNMYRPYFHGIEPFKDQVKANIWDRALQLDMDMAANRELGPMEGIRELLEGSESGVGVGFINTETLTQWREWVSEFTTWDYTWDRLRFMTRRMYQDDPGAHDMVEEFLQCVPDSLEEVYSAMPADVIASYREKVIEESVRVIKEYVGAPEAN